jgi:hypothetical protein
MSCPMCSYVTYKDIVKNRLFLKTDTAFELISLRIRLLFLRQALLRVEAYFIFLHFHEYYYQTKTVDVETD